MSVKSHRRLVAATLATLCIPLSASAPALARPADPIGPNTATSAVQQPVGDTPADFGKSPVVPDPTAGDSPSDYTSASRDRESQPTLPVQIVRPTHTIVRDSNPTLPIILAGLALMIALAAGVQMLAQRRAAPQARVH
jgi:hypothetical protein